MALTSTHSKAPAARRKTAPAFLYGPLLAVGLLLPGYFTYRFSIDTLAGWGGVSLANVLMLSPQFYAEAAASAVSSQLLSDILICTVLFFVWAYQEARRLEMRHFWIYPVLTYTVAFSVALPLFLWVRAHHLDGTGRERTPCHPPATTR
jgi:hypothetical protein